MDEEQRIDVDTLAGVLLLALREAYAAKMQAQIAFTTASALRRVLADQSPTFDSQYVDKLEALLAAMPDVARPSETEKILQMLSTIQVKKAE